MHYMIENYRNNLPNKCMHICLIIESNGVQGLGVADETDLYPAGIRVLPDDVPFGAVSLSLPSSFAACLNDDKRGGRALLAGVESRRGGTAVGRVSGRPVPVRSADLDGTVFVEYHDLEHGRGRRRRVVAQPASGAKVAFKLIPVGQTSTTAGGSSYRGGGGYGASSMRAGAAHAMALSLPESGGARERRRVGDDENALAGKYLYATGCGQCHDCG